MLLQRSQSMGATSSGLPPSPPRRGRKIGRKYLRDKEFSFLWNAERCLEFNPKQEAGVKDFKKSYGDTAVLNDIKTLSDLFHQLDMDKSGELDKQEFMRFGSHPMVGKILMHRFGLQPHHRLQLFPVVAAGRKTISHRQWVQFLAKTMKIDEQELLPDDLKMNPIKKAHMAALAREETFSPDMSATRRHNLHGYNHIAKWRIGEENSNNSWMYRNFPTNQPCDYGPEISFSLPKERNKWKVRSLSDL